MNDTPIEKRPGYEESPPMHGFGEELAALFIKYRKQEMLGYVLLTAAAEADGTFAWGMSSGACDDPLGGALDGVAKAILKDVVDGRYDGVLVDAALRHIPAEGSA